MIFMNSTAFDLLNEEILVPQSQIRDIEEQMHCAG
jgi:hypothetical protein